MMNLKIYKIGLLVLLLGLVLVACDINEIKPLNQFTKENVITNEASAQLVLNRVYGRSRDGWRLGQLKAVMGYYGVEKLRGRGVYQDAGFSTNDVQDDSGIVKTNYESFYALVNEANFFIDLVEGGAAKGITDKRKKEMLSEAKFFRALAHFNLLKVFGQFYDKNSKYGIVVSLKPIENASVKLPRTSVKDAYDKIVADLTYSMTNGREKLPKHTRVSKTTARALLAKVYLYMGDFEKAASHALAVIKNGDGYGLEAKYADIFKKRWDSKEVLFAPFVDGSVKAMASQTGYFFNGSRFAAMVSSPAFKAIAEKDARYIWAYKPDFRNSPNSNFKYPYRRYSAEGTGGNTWYYLRMSEVYLIYAEAEARRGSGSLDEALKRLNEVRKRAGVSDKTKSDKDALLKDIRDEKRLELFSENAEPYYDLVRYHVLGDVDATKLKATLKKDKFIMPIPIVALAGNPNLFQNPGYD